MVQWDFVKRRRGGGIDRDFPLSDRHGWDPGVRQSQAGSKSQATSVAHGSHEMKTFLVVVLPVLRAFIPRGAKRPQEYARETCEHSSSEEWFKVLQTTKRSQTAVMKLGAGQSTGKEAKAHEGSEQILLLIEGELAAEIEVHG